MDRVLIVHATDLGEVSDAAFHHALKMGLAAQTRLALVHATTGRGVLHLGDFPPVRQTLARWGLLDANAPQSEVSRALGLYVTKGEVSGPDEEEALARLLRDEDAKLVVLGTRGVDGLARLFDHSFSESLTRQARLPALFVPQGARGFVDAATGEVRLKNVLIPVADDPESSGALEAACRICHGLGADPLFHLLHVGEGRGMPAVRLPQGGRWTESVRSGPLVDTIVEVAEEDDADLIVMATAGHKTFLDALRGSTTEAVLRKAGRPLLAAPAGWRLRAARINAPA